MNTHNELIILSNHFKNMKTRLSTLITLLVITLSLSAQKGNVSKADYELTLPKPNLESAEEKILAAEKNEKTIAFAKTYIVKQRVYRAMYVKDNAANQNLFTAFDAIKKAEELDQKGDAKGKGIGKFKSEIKRDLIMLRVEFQNCGANAYNVKDYALAYNCFDKVLAIDNMPSNIEEDQVALLDTAILFNAAICAYYSGDMPNTEKLMTQCMEYNYGGTTPHTVMYLHYRDNSDTIKMVETLVSGFESHPDDATFLRELVVYYISINDLEQGMKYINLALDSDPNNSTFWFTKGTFHDQAKEREKAIEAYQKAIETAATNEERYNANYNLGVIFYNNAIEEANKANEVDFNDTKKLKEIEAAAKVKFLECIPYFEVCLAEKADDVEALKALRPVYYRLSDDPAIQAKYDALHAKLKELGF